MTIRMLTLAAACAGLAACANPPAPVAMPQSMSLQPAPLASGAMTRPATGASDTGSMQPFTPPAGTGSLSVGQPDQAGSNMAIPESSMGNLRGQTGTRPVPRPR